MEDNKYLSLGGATFPEIFSIVGAVLFTVAYALTMLDVYDVAAMIPEVGFIPVANQMLLLVVAIVALVGFGLFRYSRMMSNAATLPEESLSD